MIVKEGDFVSRWVSQRSAALVLMMQLCCRYCCIISRKDDAFDQVSSSTELFSQSELHLCDNSATIKVTCSAFMKLVPKTGSL